MYNLLLLEKPSKGKKISRPEKASTPKPALSAGSQKNKRKAKMQLSIDDDDDDDDDDDGGGNRHDEDIVDDSQDVEESSKYRLKYSSVFLDKQIICHITREKKIKMIRTKHSLAFFSLLVLLHVKYQFYSSEQEDQLRKTIENRHARKC